MQLRFIGCGDAFGSGGRFNTCFHVTGEHVNFLIDCGASSLPAMKRSNIARDEIDLILITQAITLPAFRSSCSTRSSRGVAARWSLPGRKA